MDYITKRELYITKRELYIPKDAIKIEYPEIKYTAYTWEKAGDFYFRLFGGRRFKADAYQSAKTEDLRQNYLNGLIREKVATAIYKDNYKAEKKAKANEAFKDVKVGDIFYTSWGYDQTNVEFYKLMVLKGKTGTFQALSSETVEGSEGMMSAKVVPGDKFISKPFTSRITGDVATQMKYGQRAYKTDAKKEHYSSWYA